MSIESTEIADHSQRHIRVPTSAWALYQLNAVHDAGVSRTSLNLGVAGIAVMCMVASTVSLIRLNILMNIDGPGHPFVGGPIHVVVPHKCE